MKRKRDHGNPTNKKTMAGTQLGSGAYGTVFSKGNSAYKSFKKLNALIQEFVAGAFLSNCKNIVKVSKAHYNKLQLKMDLYQMNLRKWMESVHTQEQKKKAFFDILIALAEIHRREIVHGDVKPGNILVNEDKKGMPQCFLGDLGFVSLSKFSKVQRTTEAYRDKLMLPNSGHDLYSVGIVALELFGNVRIRRQVTHAEVKAQVAESIKDKDLAHYIIALTDPDYRKRPSAEHILEKLYNYDPTLHVRPCPEYKKVSIDEDKFKHVEKWMRSLSKEYNIARAKRGYKCLLLFFVENSISSKEHAVYTAVMMMVLSAVFGKSGFDDKKAAKWAECHHDDILQALAALLSDANVISGLLNP